MIFQSILLTNGPTKKNGVSYSCRSSNRISKNKNDDILRNENKIGNNKRFKRKKEKRKRNNKIKKDKEDYCYYYSFVRGGWREFKKLGLLYRSSSRNNKNNGFLIKRMKCKKKRKVKKYIPFTYEKVNNIISVQEQKGNFSSFYYRPFYYTLFSFSPPPPPLHYSFIFSFYFLLNTFY